MKFALPPGINLDLALLQKLLLPLSQVSFEQINYMFICMRFPSKKQNVMLLLKLNTLRDNGIINFPFFLVFDCSILDQTDHCEYFGRNLQPDNFVSTTPSSHNLAIFSQALDGYRLISWREYTSFPLELRRKTYTLSLSLRWSGHVPELWLILSRVCLKEVLFAEKPDPPQDLVKGKVLYDQQNRPIIKGVWKPPKYNGRTAISHYIVKYKTVKTEWSSAANATVKKDWVFIASKKVRNIHCASDSIQ